MDIEIRPVHAEESNVFSQAVYTAFGQHPTAEAMEVHRKVFEPRWALAAEQGGKVIGTAAAYSLLLTVPGDQVAMPGVTAVGVHPTHRRRGILTKLMRRQLDDFHAAGQTVAGLWASEGPIYGRFGYGMATLSTDLAIDRQWNAFVGPYAPSGSMRLVEKDEALKTFPAVYERVLPTHPGMLSRSPEWWDRMYSDLEQWRDGASALFYAVHESSQGEPDGFVSYRVKHSWADDRHSLFVYDLVTATPEAYAGVWRFCLDHDLIHQVQAWPRQTGEPLLHMLAHPRHLNLKVMDGLWIRLVDVPMALAARRYATESRLVFEVRDAFCLWNEGRFELEGGPDGADCRPTSREPDLVLEAGDIGAVYLGGVRFGTLARAGRVAEARSGALARADAMFTWDPLPWCPHLF